MSEKEIQKIKCIHLVDYKASNKLCPAIEMLKKEKEKNKKLNKVMNEIIKIDPYIYIEQQR